MTAANWPGVVQFWKEFIWGTSQEGRVKHELKTKPEFFQAAWLGLKPFEIRNNDRKFKERDEIVLREWDPDGYTGRVIEGVIEYVTDFMQQPGYVVFSYRETERFE